ncbi:MAG: carboxypeptidase regulatory-like domain-containing protein, partial [Acidobacteria bacterium]|nr:carboxypeptidase regulatory-like domain-containing protein [Acidobacteriota bacterium]
MNPQGFFHFRDIAPGSYVLEASQEGLGSARFFPVTVMENAETEIFQPLMLEPPLELVAQVQPVEDAYGRPWRWALYRQSDVLEQLTRIDEGEMSPEGRLVRQGLDPGAYRLAVLDGEGSRFGFYEIGLSPSTLYHEFELPLVWVEGSLLLGGEPVQAELYFGGLGGDQRVQVVTGAEGRFSSFLPREGHWRITVLSDSPFVRRTLRSVEVRRIPGERSATVDIDLPDTEMEGEVVDEWGNPVFGAVVRQVELDGLLPSAAKTDRKGRFRFRGLAEGEISLLAEDGDKKSDQVTLEVREEAPIPPVRLVVRSGWKVEGMVTSSSGGVPGARILAGSYRTSGALILYGDQTNTDIEGKFELSLPAAASE